MTKKPTIKSLIDSAQWYQRTRARLVEDYGPDADLMADLIASTSPQRPVEHNLQLAKEVYKRYCLFDDWEAVVGLLPNHKTNIHRAFSREPLRGLKVSAFARNLKGDLSVPSIDTWVLKYMKFNKRLTPNRHKKLVEKMKRNAKSHGLKPAEYQAIIWVLIRGGKTAKRDMFDKLEV